VSVPSTSMAAGWPTAARESRGRTRRSNATGRLTWHYARHVPENTGDVIGWRAELDTLQGALVDREADAPRVVQIAGEPGIGKTRLVAEVRARAERPKHLVFNGRAAESELSDRGAMRFADEAARELRRLDRRVTSRRRRGAGDLGLSRCELEVGRLVTAGKTNREIAVELFVCEQTVEDPLDNVFAKPGVSARAAVAGVLARRLGTE
jgi:ATP/maltotriose-dependent transcriptional regulator MalT